MKRMQSFLIVTLLIVVGLFTAQAQAITADNVEAVIGSGSIFLDLGPGTYTRSGLTATTTANLASDWNWPDTSDADYFVSNCLDDKSDSASDFLVTISGFDAYEEFTLGVQVLGKYTDVPGYDFSCGLASDGAAIYTISDVTVGTEVYNSGGTMSTFTVILGDFSADSNGDFTFWLGNGVNYSSTTSDDRTELDGIVVLPDSVKKSCYWDDGDTGNSLWTDPDNWTTYGDHAPPAAWDSANIRMDDIIGDGDGPVIQDGINAICRKLSFDIDGTGDTLTMAMTGGTLTVAGSADSYFRLGAGGGPGTVVFDMTGGVVRVSGLLRVAAYYTAHLNLWGGTINTNQFEIEGAPPSYVDIRNDGELIVDGDVASDLQKYVDQKLTLLAYGGAGEVNISYSSTSGKTTVTAIAPDRAYEPTPIENGTGVDVNATLSWTAGDGTDSHNVYFGTDWDSVNSASTSDSEYVRNQTSNSIARTVYHSSGSLDSGKAYYWRIDDIDGSTTTKGEVWSFSTESFVGAGYSVQNPVLYKVADSGVMKYNGEYYIMGTDTYGDMLSSENLVNWGQASHVFSMDNDWATGSDGDDERIHACDVQYVDGVFHLYWSVNLDTVKGIGHATSTSGPMGPYTEPVTTTMFGTKIDPCLFIDDDGSAYFYTVKFPSGNVSYGQAMTDPWTLTGTDYWLIDAYTGGGDWETDDGSHINEGPEVMKYRDKYYLLYADNHTVGCAESTGPLAFDGDDKYLDPVIERITRGGHTITETGQANMLRGPNGFEWWMSYFVEYDGDKTSQAIDRVLFFDRHLYMAGPSSNLASYTGLTYTPPPAAPTFGDIFSTAASATYWDLKAGSWSISGGEATQTLTTGSDNMAIIKSAAARNYLVECGVELIDPYTPGEKAGVVAYYKDSSNWMAVALDQKDGTWYYHKVEDGTTTSHEYSLSSGFDFNDYHTIRVTKNNTDFHVWIDECVAPSNPVISTGFEDAGLPGLYTRLARANFDGFTYTIGWDEYDDEITGWGSADSGTGKTGTWSVSSSGIDATDSGTTNRIYKGDLLAEYEFMTQVTRTSTVPVDSDPHTMGIYAVYIDSKNWMVACIDLVNDKLKVYGEQNDSSIGNFEAPVEYASSYNLRVIKRNDSTRIFVNGELKIDLLRTWGPSQVGLRAEEIAARYNGITLFGLGSQYGDSSPSNYAMSDNFDDSIISSKWQQMAIHTDDVTKHDHDKLPDIVVHETNKHLQFSGTETGDDSSPWYGRGLKYIDPVYGDSTCEFNFDSLLAYSDDGAAPRTAVGLRIWKDSNNWFEVRQTDDADGDRLQTVAVNNGVKTTSSAVSSATSGSLKIVFTNSTGTAQCFLSGVSKGSVSMSGMANSNYYVYITAYTSNPDNRIACNVDDFEISSSASDTASPTPSPMTFSTSPTATGATSISMTATTAPDASAVEYYFDCTAGGGNDSGWQDSTVYIDTGLTPATQYTYKVTARDKSASQNTTTASSTASATTDSVSGWTQIVYEDFEGGYGNWVDGGTDCILYTGTYAYQGDKAVNLRDNTSTSVVSTRDLALSSYTEIKVDFAYICISMDSSAEDFWLQISTDGGSSYTTVEEWNRDDEFVNGQFYTDSVTITGYTLNDQTRLRFRCDATGDPDDVYIDTITVSAAQ